MMGIRNLNRWQAGAGHFAFSVLLGLAVFALFRFVWYPDALFTLAGAGKLLILVVGIDVTLGPLLTLIVFNPIKKSLVWDLAVILMVQLGALGYGVWVMAQSRPVFLVGAVDRFELVSANEIHPDELAKAPHDEWRRLSWTGPVVLGVLPPEEAQERMARLLEAAQGGSATSQLPKYFVPLSDVSSTLLAHARPLSDYDRSHPEETAALRRWASSRNWNESALAVLPIKARAGFGAVIIERSSGKPLITADFDGFAPDSAP